MALWLGSIGMEGDERMTDTIDELTTRLIAARLATATLGELERVSCDMLREIGARCGNFYVLALVERALTGPDRPASAVTTPGLAQLLSGLAVVVQQAEGRDSCGSGRVLGGEDADS